MRPLPKSMLQLTVLAVLIVQSGCALRRLPPPPPEAPRALFGTMGVVSARFVPEARLEGPTSGKGVGAAKGAGLGAGHTMAGTLEGVVRSGHPYLAAAVLAVGIALTPIGALVGGIYGAVTAESLEKVRAAESALSNAFLELGTQESLRDRLLHAAGERGRHLPSLADSGPTSSDETVDYRSFAKDVDTILEVSVTRIAFSGSTGINPPLGLTVGARIRLIRTADGIELYALPGRHNYRLEYRSEPRKLNEWAVNDAQLFREELDRAYRSLAEQIVFVLFLY